MKSLARCRLRWALRQEMLSSGGETAEPEVAEEFPPSVARRLSASKENARRWVTAGPAF
jgi:hypothetical protein